MSIVGYLGAAARQAQALEDVAQRPWPLPEAPWAQAQSREDVLLAHWRVQLEQLARLGPPGLPIDTYKGEAWLGVAAFRLTKLRLRGLPPLPSLAFGQLDVFTYVNLGGRPGLWLHTVDTSSRVLAEAAKRSHRLPAHYAEFAFSAEGTPHAGTPGDGAYAVVRDDLAFEARFRVTGRPFAPRPGSLEHFLTERYCLYTSDGGRLYRAELHHPPWSLRRARASIDRNTLAPIALEDDPLVLHSEYQDLLVWSLEEI
jgi:uncharacterized protein YqjF (DUF2071 family)